ncbi:MAG: helicase-related protein, partial [Caulobacteraceae bacterium]
MSDFSPGDLVRARGREWVALPSQDDGVLRLRPLLGAESDVQALVPLLERRKPEPARFPPPEPTPTSTQDGARLLSEALRLSLRRGAGPFRSAARVAFEPRAYQLVPLLMALRLPHVRLLIADDVGVGKTVEAGLILRELIDRGELDRFTILCPPHLVEQWTEELRVKFDLDAVAVTSATAARLERGLPLSESLFDALPYSVVSLDYIKADRRRDAFAAACPRMVVVDEAHACVGADRGRHQRFELLRRLAADAERELILLTATPHSGDEAAFDRLIGLIDPAFIGGAGFETEAARVRLARHFVQRRRVDITGQEWGEDRVFPRHETAEHIWRFDQATAAFHDAVLDWCLGMVEDKDAQGARLAFWGVLALMRCVGSSPAAAVSALRNRLAADADRLAEQVFDDEADDADAVDLEPASGLETAADPQLAELVERAETLTKCPDPKLAELARVLKGPLEEGANPVVFCRYIATVAHLAAGLRRAFPNLVIEEVTGALSSEERRAKVEAMAVGPEGEAAPQHLLVATDCLSEGINLQKLFDTVVHYDLSWNPTRHQQREGRVDRFGQPAERVRSVLMYSPDSAIDGAVLDVILRKAEHIRLRTGVSVPLPEDRAAVTGALMNRLLLHKGRARQLTLDFGDQFQAQSTAMETLWRDAEEGEKRSRARFAQNAIKPEEAAPEWRRWRDVLGGGDEVRTFVDRALARLMTPLENKKGGVFLAHLDALPTALRERLAGRGLSGSVRIGFEESAPDAMVVTRAHPLTATLAETLLEGALDPAAGPPTSLGRAGAWPSASVTNLTTIALLRLRFKLTIQARRERLLLAEEAQAVAFSGGRLIATGDEARRLLEAEAAGDLVPAAQTRLLFQARERLDTDLAAPLSDFARDRATTLADDHERVRSADGRRA